jgi:tRNA-2-methylthio-N6-dimethylallyladenosine synthase
MQSFTYFSRTFGCQMNVADLADISARLCALGGSEVLDPENADLVMVNTCTVRKKAEDKAYSYFAALKRAKRDGRPFIVGMGCLVPGAGGRLAELNPHLDLLLEYSDPDLVLSELQAHFPPLAQAQQADLAAPLLNGGVCRHSFITAIRGCDHGCSYCVVPLARGPQRDVPLARILAQAQAYEAAGAADIALLGQNILAYGQASGAGHPGFIELMETLLAGTGFRWITYLTSLPTDLTDEICERVIAQPRITPLLHLPLQSGSDNVLRDMRRGHDVAHYQRMVAKARSCRPDIFLTTDLLVGFPTETDADFEATLELVETTGFNDAFMFAYSPRPGTYSALNYPDNLARERKIARLVKLISRQRELAAQLNRRYIGTVLPVIIEQIDAKGAVARTAFNKPVRLPQARTPVGRYSQVQILDVKVSSFSGIEVGLE